MREGGGEGWEREVVMGWEKEGESSGGEGVRGERGRW